MKDKNIITCGCSTNFIPVFCQLGVFTKNEFELHKTESRTLIKELPKEKKEIEEGFIFIYKGDEKLFLRLAQWISREHRCCAWANFHLDIHPFDLKHSQHGGTIILTVTGGGKEGKQVLKQGLVELGTENAL